MAGPAAVWLDFAWSQSLCASVRNDGRHRGGTMTDTAAELSPDAIVDFGARRHKVRRPGPWSR